ncbi:unnamed protein product [Aphanomyces euteiches]
MDPTGTEEEHKEGQFEICTQMEHSGTVLPQGNDGLGGPDEATAGREDATRADNAVDEASSAESSEDSSTDGSDGVVKDMSNMWISEDENSDHDLDEKTRKHLEMREKNRLERERRERRKTEKYGLDFRRAESDSSVTSLSGEDTDVYNNRKYQKGQAKKSEKKRENIELMRRNHRMYSTVVVTDIKHPRITNFDRKFLVEWKTKRLEYERLLRDKCRHTGQAKSQMVGYIKSCDPSLLRAMCETIWFEPDITEKRLRDRIEEILKTPSHSFGITEADLEDYYHDLRMPAIGSVVSRLGLFMMQVNEVIDRYALKKDLKVKGSLKIARSDQARTGFYDRRICQVVREQMDRIEASDPLAQQQGLVGKKRSPPIGWTNSDVKRRRGTPVKVHVDKVMGWGDGKGVVGAGSQYAEEQAYDLPRDHEERKQRAEERRRVWENMRYNRNSASPARRGPAGGYGTGNSNSPFTNDKYGPKDTQARSGKLGYRAGNIVCYACQTPGHKLNECPENSPNSQIKGYRKGRNAVKRFKLNHKKPKARAAATNETEEEERWIVLNDVLEVPYCPDTGADQNIIPRRVVDALIKEQPSVKIVTLAEPISGTGCNDLQFETKAYVELRLSLQTAAGMVKIPGRRVCYIVEEGDEFLASHETLKSIGLDIDRWLEQVAIQQREADGDDLGAESDAGIVCARKSTSDVEEDEEDRTWKVTRREERDDDDTRMSGLRGHDVGSRMSRAPSDDVDTRMSGPQGHDVGSRMSCSKTDDVDTRKSGQSSHDGDSRVSRWMFDGVGKRESNLCSQDGDTRMSQTRSRRIKNVRVYSMQLRLPVAKNKLEEALQEMVVIAVKNGFPRELAAHMWSVLIEYDIWRIKFNGQDPPAKVKPLRVTPKDGCVP